MKLKGKGLFLLVSLLLLPFGGGAVPFAPLDYSAGSGALPSGWTAQPANAASFRTAGDGTAILRLESAGGKSATLLSPRCETAGKEGILRFTVSLQSENRKGKAILYLLDSRGKVLDSKRLEMGEVREKISLSVPLSRIGEPRIVRFRIDATKDAVLQIAALKTALVPEDEAERKQTVEPKPGTMPSAWFAAENRTAECGWNRDFQFRNRPGVLRLRADSRPLMIHSEKQTPLPDTEKLILSFSARSTGSSGTATLFLVEEKYRFHPNRKIALTELWQDFRFEVPIPEKWRKSRFFFRIDVPAGTDLLIGDLKISRTKGSRRTARTGNLLKNGEFLFGSSNYDALKYGRDPLFRNPYALFRDGSCILHAPYFLLTDMISYEPGKEYTALVRMRRARRGEPATALVIMTPTDWQKVYGYKIQLTDEFKDYPLTGKFTASFFNLLSFRIDARAGAVEIARIQFIEGTRKTFLDRPELEIGGKGSATFRLKEADAAVTVRIRNNGNAPTPPLRIRICDDRGRELSRRELPVPPGRDQELRIPVDTGRRGVFRIELQCGSAVNEWRYAVLKDLRGKSLPDNLLGGHFHPLFKPDLKLFQPYLPMRVYNRFFPPAPELLEKQDVQACFREFPIRRNIIIFPLKRVQDAGLGTRVLEKLPPELEQRFLREVEWFAKLAGKCGFHGVELFNEPFLWRVKKGPDQGRPTMPPELVAHLYKLAYPVLKKHAPFLTVYGPCTANSEPVREYNERFLKAGGAEGIDVFSFHSYNGDADLEKVAEQNESIRKMANAAKPGLPICNTEVYYGVRRHRRFFDDMESRKSYCKDSERELAAAYAAFYANSIVSSTPFSLFAPEFCIGGVPGTEEQYPLASAAALNAGMELLGNVGKERKILRLDDSLRCFLFLRAEGGPIATLRKLSQSPAEFSLPEGVRAFDLYGNPIAGKKIVLDSALLYLRFPAGSDAEKILTSLEFKGLGAPFDTRMTMLDEKTPALRLRNRTARVCEVSVTPIRFPAAWIPVESAGKTIRLAPFSEGTLRFPMKKLSLRGGRNQLVLALQSGSYRNEIVYDLNLIPVRFSQDFSFRPSDYIHYGAENLSRKFGNRPNRGEKDCSADLAALWNERGLKLSVKVTDDHFIPPGEEFAKAYQSDSLQLYFAMGQNHSKENKNRSGDLLYSIGLRDGKTPFAWMEHSTGNRFIGAANATVGLDDAVKVSARRGPAGCVDYEIFLPREVLYQIRLSPGSIFRFAMLVNDNDGSGRKQGITLTSPGTEPGGQLSLFPSMVLLSPEKP